MRKHRAGGSNSFTTTVKEDTVEFDSAKDKFTFKDEVEVPSLKVNGQTVSSQVQADWNQTNTSAVDYIKNKPTIPSSQVQADWNQNNSASTDYIKNRICSSILVSRGFSSNDPDIQYVTDSYGSVKAYFRIPEIDYQYLEDYLSNRVLTVANTYGTESSVMLGNWEDYTEESKLYRNPVTLFGESDIYVCLEDSYTTYGDTYNKGLYIPVSEGDTIYVAPIETVSKIDNKFIPYSQAREFGSGTTIESERFYFGYNEDYASELVFDAEPLVNSYNSYIEFKGTTAPSGTSLTYKMSYLGSDKEIPQVLSNISTFESNTNYMFYAVLVKNANYYNEAELLNNSMLIINFTKIS